jgi:hypothetical protein
MEFITVGASIARVAVPPGMTFERRKCLRIRGETTYCVFEYHGLEIEIEQSLIRQTDGNHSFFVGIPSAIDSLPTSDRGGYIAMPIRRQDRGRCDWDESSPGQENAIRAMEDSGD